MLDVAEQTCPAVVTLEQDGIRNQLGFACADVRIYAWLIAATK
jgi:hypothetical protein